MSLPRRKNLSSQSGFTLLEIVMALVLLMLVFSFYQLMLEAINFTNRGRFDDIGRSVAIEQLEIYRATDFGLLDVETVSISDPDLDLLPNGSGTVTFEDYSSVDSGIMKITVAVNWTNRGDTRDVVLTSLLTDGGVGK